MSISKCFWGNRGRIVLVSLSILGIGAGCGKTPKGMEEDLTTDDIEASDETEADTETENDMDFETEMDAGEDAGEESEAAVPFSAEWTFDEDWEDFRPGSGDVSFVHDAEEGTVAINGEFTGPSEEASFGREFYAADWRGVTAIDIVLRTETYQTGFWRIDLYTSYAWTPCSTYVDHPDTAEWTTVTFDILEVCGDSVMLEMTQALVIVVSTGEDATGPENIVAAVDSITVR